MDEQKYKLSKRVMECGARSKYFSGAIAFAGIVSGDATVACVGFVGYFLGDVVYHVENESIQDSLKGDLENKLNEELTGVIPEQWFEVN